MRARLIFVLINLTVQTEPMEPGLPLLHMGWCIQSLFVPAKCMHDSHGKQNVMPDIKMSRIFKFHMIFLHAD